MSQTDQTEGEHAEVEENPQAAEQRLIGVLREALSAGNAIRENTGPTCGHDVGSISGPKRCALEPGHDEPHSTQPPSGRPSRENSLAVTKVEEAIMWATQDAQRKNT